MIQTMKLRFVKRAVTVRTESNPEIEPQFISVLQQWFVDEYASDSGVFEPKGEWRDVQLEVEN